ncbi:MAG: alpha/beta fold hydrolase [Nocardioidaceae bacterium]
MTSSNADRDADRNPAKTLYLPRPEGRIAYDVSGSGPLIVCIPGMGDIRSTFRHLVPALEAAGNRVATMDLRGHGDSDITFSSYDDNALADDIRALIAELGEPAVLVGSSMGAASAIIAAAAAPDQVRGLVLLGPWAREPDIGLGARALTRVAMAPLWARFVWKAYQSKLYPGTKPDDFEQHRDAIVASLKRPGYAKAFSVTTHSTHEPAEAAIGSVKAPALVVMGERDPDFPDPAAEAKWIGQRLDARGVMVREAGHYPHGHRPEIVIPTVVGFVTTINADA